MDDVLGVTFLVERKLSRASLERSGALIPRYLYTYAAVGGERTLCAIPTDVEALQDYRIHAQGEDIYVTQKERNNPWTRGVLTCRVRFPGDPANQLVLSCLHVFAMTGDDSTSDPAKPTAGRWVRFKDCDGSEAATVSGYLGRLRVDGESFDSAAAFISKAELVDLALPAHPTQQHSDPDSTPRDVLIHTPFAAIRAEHTHRWGTEVPVRYKRPDGGLFHSRFAKLLELQSMRPTAEGWSGSPVTDLTGTTLLGMHIAGDGHRAFMLPARDVLWMANYGGLSRRQGFFELF